MNVATLRRLVRHPAAPWLLLVAWNVPVITSWLIITHPASYVFGATPALYALLLLGIIGMLLLPIFVGNIRRKPWILITLTGTANIYWAILWIAVFTEHAPDPPYPAYRQRIIIAILATTVLSGILYGIASRLLQRRRNTPSDL